MTISQKIVRVVTLAILALSVPTLKVWGQVSPSGVAIKTVQRPLGVCRMGADPVDPTFKWVPPATWRLVKTDKPQQVTMNSGSGKESACLLPPGSVIGYPPDGGKPVVLLCKNTLTVGRPTGTEIPRGVDTVSMVAQRAAMSDTVVHLHIHRQDGAFVVNHLSQTTTPVPMQADYQVRGRGFWCFRSFGNGFTCSAALFAAGYGIYSLASRGGDDNTPAGVPPLVVTDPAKCQANTHPNRCPGAPGVGNMIFANGMNFNPMRRGISFSF